MTSVTAGQSQQSTRKDTVRRQNSGERDTLCCAITRSINDRTKCLQNSFLKPTKPRSSFNDWFSWRKVGLNGIVNRYSDELLVRAVAEFIVQAVESVLSLNGPGSDFRRARPRSRHFIGSISYTCTCVADINRRSMAATPTE